MMDVYFRINPLQATLFEMDEPILCFVVRRHHATILHWDLRIEANGILYSWFMQRPPTSDPTRPVWAGLAGPHNPRYMLSERYIEPGKPGAGPTLVEDLGTAKPLVTGSLSQARAFHECFLNGQIPLLMYGRLLKGGYVIERNSRNWQFRKLDDSHATTTPLDWNGISPISGLTLEDLVPRMPKE